MTPELRYRQAVQKARIISRRALRQMLRGEVHSSACQVDLERRCLIEEIGRAYEAGRRAGQRGVTP